MGASAGGGMGGGSSGEMSGAPRQTSMGGNTGSGMGVNNPYAFGPQGSYGSPMGGFQGGNRFGGGFQRGFGSFGGGMGGMPVQGGPMPGQQPQQPAPSQQQALADAFNQRNVEQSPQDMGNMQNLHSAVRNDMRFQRPSSQPVDPARFQQIRQQQMQNQFSPMMNSGGFGMQQPMQNFGRMGNQGIGGAMNYMSGPRASNIGSMLNLLGMR